MAFNPKNYKPPLAKPFPVILLLDVSGSMYGDKIDSLYDAVVEMVKVFEHEAIKETLINVAIITFGDEVLLHTPYTPVSTLAANGISRFVADGMTPMGTALRMAKDMIEDRETTSSKCYRPAVILVSDGEPNDDWRKPMEQFVNSGRTQKCQRFSVAIGNDANRSVLRMFADNDASMFEADNVSELAEKFRKISITVSQRATSKNPNVVPKAENVSYDPPAYSAEDEDDDGGLW